MKKVNISPGYKICKTRYFNQVELAYSEDEDEIYFDFIKLDCSVVYFIWFDDEEKQIRF